MICRLWTPRARKSNEKLVGGLEHFYFSPIVGMMIQSDYIIFFRGVETTNQKPVFYYFTSWPFHLRQHSVWKSQQKRWQIRFAALLEQHVRPPQFCLSELAGHGQFSACQEDVSECVPIPDACSLGWVLRSFQIYPSLVNIEKANWKMGDL